MMGFVWGLNGSKYGSHRPLTVRQNERVEIEMVNRHPPDPLSDDFAEALRRDLVVFEDDQIHDLTSENGFGKGENEGVESGVRLLARVPLRGGPGA